MSGIVGIVNLDGRPVDPELLQTMTADLSFRGPDAMGTWREGSIGLGHTLFATTDEAMRESQPTSLDGSIWITADARIDGRVELWRKLEAKGKRDLQDATDAELILHTYDVWGEACVDHLLGDFAFGIWDEHRQTLFCARDHFGVKHFYYADLVETFLFSNTLKVLRTHPGVAADLDDLGIADYLLFGATMQPEKTIFRDILFLPPGHVLKVQEGRVSLRRYWTLPQDGEIRYRQNQEYVDHFQEVFDISVTDRLRRSPVGIDLSGGMDSASIAASAIARQPENELLARTSVYDRLIPDVERHWSSVLAESLGIAHQISTLDDSLLFDDWLNPMYVTPEPTTNPSKAMLRRALEQVAGNRVVLNGTGGDPVLFPSRSFPMRMVTQGRFLFLVKGMLDYRRMTGTFPAPYLRSGINSLRLNRRPLEVRVPQLPVWISPEFVSQYALIDRVAQMSATPERYDHPLRAEAYSSLDQLFWRHEFKAVDVQNHGVAVEWRYPFFDVRLVSYALAIPPLPWFENKLILREAMRGRMPEEVRVRPKTPLQGIPKHRYSSSVNEEQLREVIAVPGIERFIDGEAALRAIRDTYDKALDPDEARELMVPFEFAHWLQCSDVIY